MSEIKNLVLYFDVSKDDLIEEISDYLLDNKIAVIESRILLAGTQVIFVICVCQTDYPIVFPLFFYDGYLTNKLILKNETIEDFGQIN